MVPPSLGGSLNEGPFLVQNLVRRPYKRDPKRDPNLENYPLEGRYPLDAWQVLLWVEEIETPREPNTPLIKGPYHPRVLRISKDPRFRV